MDWVNLKLHASGQYMLEALCSRLSYDINQFNRLPKELRWLPGEGAKSFKLFRLHQRSIATICWKFDHHDGQYRPPIIELRAHEHDVYVDFPNSTYLSQTITFVPAESEWRIAAGGFDSTTVSDVWEVSQRILSTHLFPPEID